jgi:hypothetical protein
MATVSTEPIPEQFAEQIVNWPTGVQQERIPMPREIDTKSLEPDAIESLIQTLNRLQNAPKRTESVWEWIGSPVLPDFVYGNLTQAAANYDMQCSRCLVDRDETRALVIDQVQIMAAIVQRASKRANVGMGSFPDRVRLPIHSVRIARWQDVEETEWDPVAYDVGQAIEKYFERADADSETPQ